MTKDQAIAYDQEITQPYLAQVREDERENADAFDITNPYSLVGSVMTGALPYFSNNLLQTVANFGSLALNPFKIFAPKASAYSPEQYYSVCGYDDYAKMNIATDPFCNPVYGLPADFANRDPDDVLLFMLGKSSDNSTPYIDNDGNPLGLYQEFRDNCSNNINPYGLENEDTGEYIKSPDCMVGSGKYPDNFYIYTVDDAVSESMSCTMDDVDSDCYGASGTSSSASTSTSAGTLDAQGLMDEFATTGGNYGAYHVSSNGCTTLAAWYVGTKTDLKYGNGNGGDVVTKLVAANTDAGLSVSHTPQVGALFSSRDAAWHASSMCGDTKCGHVGLVVGVDGNKVTILETYSRLGDSSPYVRQSQITWNAGQQVDFVYLGDHLK